MFQHEEIVKLLRGDPIDSALPFDSHDEQTIKAFYEPIIEAAESRFGLASRVEWNHYGSGYASFVDAWFYRADQSGRLSSYSDHHVGIWVLLSRTTRYFVMGQGEKTWSSKGGSSYMPCFDSVDDIDHPAIAPFTQTLAEHVTNAGLVRLRREHLARPLDPIYGVPGILSGPPFHHFDALFHWED
jgi:hypothetical protein